MDRNKIIDFLCDQSIDKDKVLYEMLKEENNLIDNESEYFDKKIPLFVNRTKCNKCRYYQKGSCQSSVAVRSQGCGEPDYKYFEEK